MFSIGEFSKITGLTVKTLRFYHEQGILEPSSIDPDNGYRYYADSKIETARVIVALRDLDFPLADIAAMVRGHDDDSGILEFLESHNESIQARIRNDRRISRLLVQIIHQEKEAHEKMSESPFEVSEKTIEPVLIAGLRMKGKYSDCGKGFGRIGRKYGRHICGKAMLLCYDTEYRENDADYEVCMPVRRGESGDEISVRELAGGRCLSLMHRGPYHELSRSYEIIIKHAKDSGLVFQSPTREVYHKGPGMIFRGNPQKYLTEIQLLLEP